MKPCLVLSLLVSLAGVAEAQPNILVLVLDDVGVDIVDAYGMAAPIAATPTIDALANQGLLFRNAWVSPLCSASRAAMLTGRYGFRNGVGGAKQSLLPGELTLPDAVPAGYTTAALGKWHVSHYRPWDPPLPAWSYTPMMVGFDSFRGTTGNFSDQWQPEGAHYFLWSKSIELVEGAPIWEPDHTTYATTELVDDALDFIQAQSGPWFAWVAFQAAHDPLQAPPEDLHDRQVVKDTYDAGDLAPGVDEVHWAMVEAMDTEIARLLAAVDLANTYVFVIGDNGTAPGQKPPGAVLRGGKGGTYEGGIRVPLIVAGPGVAQGETEALVHGIDLYPTIASLVGVDVATLPVNLPFDGVSFALVLAVPDSGLRTTVYVDGRFDKLSRPGSELPENHDVAIRNADYKLIRRACEDGARSWEFYHLAADPGEANDLFPVAGPHAQALLELTGALGSLVGNPSCGPPTSGCGAGVELVLAIPALAFWRGRRRPDARGGA